MDNATIQNLFLAAAPVLTILGATWFLGGQNARIIANQEEQKRINARTDQDRKDCETRHDADITCMKGEVADQHDRIDLIDKRLIMVEAKVE